MALQCRSEPKGLLQFLVATVFPALEPDMLPSFADKLADLGRISEAVYLANWELHHPGEFRTGQDCNLAHLASLF
eukprot:s12846_g1.t1